MRRPETRQRKEKPSEATVRRVRERACGGDRQERWYWGREPREAGRKGRAQKNEGTFLLGALSEETSEEEVERPGTGGVQSLSCSDVVILVTSDERRATSEVGRKGVI